MGYAGKHRIERPKRHWIRATAITTAVVLVGVLAGGVFLYRHLEGNIDVVDVADALGTDRPDIPDAVDRKALNILLLGSDDRSGQSEVLGSTPGLSDTTILLHLSADRERAYGVSIPRDLMVERPDCTNADGDTIPGGFLQFNSAFAVGGPACAIKTVEAMTDVRINHYVVVKFENFKNMVDALDGVPVCVPKEVNDDTGRIYLPAGSYEVKGQQALDYVRVRYAISQNGDIGRMKRQQAFLAAMVNKVMSKGTLANPARLVSFLNAATQSLQTDPGLGSLSKLASLGRQVQQIGMDQIQFLSVPFEQWEVDRNRLVLTDEAQPLFTALRNDKPLPKVLREEVTTASQTPGGSDSEAEDGETDGAVATPSETSSPSPTSPSPSTTPQTEEAAAEAEAARAAEAAANGLCA